MESKSRTGSIIATVLALVVLIGGGLYLVNRSDDTEQTIATSQQPASQEQSQTRQTIVDAAAANSDFSTLVTAVKAADLAPTLSGEEKYTVFAPTNAAFDKLPAGTVETLLKPENKELLKGILTYHVVSGEVLSTQLTNGQKVPTVNGAELTVSIENGTVYLIDAKGGRATITQADIKVDNGVIHAIDSVVMPQ